MDEPAQMLLFDPQTSGGLLLGVPQSKLDAFKKRAEELNQPVWVIGEVRAGKGIEVSLIMFHISVVELAFTCGVILLLLVVPVMLRRFYMQMDKRLKNIEKKVDKKKE